MKEELKKMTYSKKQIAKRDELVKEIRKVFTDYLEGCADCCDMAYYGYSIGKRELLDEVLAQMKKKWDLDDLQEWIENKKKENGKT